MCNAHKTIMFLMRPKYFWSFRNTRLHAGWWCSSQKMRWCRFQSLIYYIITYLCGARGKIGSNSLAFSYFFPPSLCPPNHHSSYSLSIYLWLNNPIHHYNIPCLIDCNRYWLFWILYKQTASITRGPSQGDRHQTHQYISNTEGLWLIDSPAVSAQVFLF